MKRSYQIRTVALSALFLALAYVLPFVTGQIPQFGAMLCPMHIPVLLCGFFCGWLSGLAVGAIAPLLRSLTLGVPLLFPSAICMAFELATYGAVAGLLYRLLPSKKPYVYVSLLGSMLAGRLIWGCAMAICLGIGGNPFTFSAFLAGAFTGSIPGIILQIIIVPVTVMLPPVVRLMRQSTDKHTRQTQ